MVAKPGFLTTSGSSLLALTFSQLQKVLESGSTLQQPREQHQACGVSLDSIGNVYRTNSKDRGLLSRAARRSSGQKTCCLRRNTVNYKNPTPNAMLNVMNPTTSHFLNHSLREQRGETCKIRE
jgi:hypothetical protein